jgi:CRP-like cAMP-binding protein
VCAVCARTGIGCAEREHIESLDSTKKVGQWFIIESGWLSHWRSFVGGGERPGRIDNRCLVEEDEDGVYVARGGLKKADDYRAVNHKVWAFFMERYGGGPTLVRPKVDIYAPEVWRAAPKTKEEEQLIKAALDQPSCALPDMVNHPEIRQQVIDAMLPRHYDEDVELMRQGQIDSDFAIVGRGQCVMQVVQQRGKKIFSRNQKPIEVPLTEGDPIGHMLRGSDGHFEAAQANIRTSTECMLWTLSQGAFTEIERLFKKRVQDRMEKFLKASAALLKNSQPHTIHAIAAELEQKHYTCDAVVAPTAGQPSFFFVMEGEFAVIGEKSSKEHGSPRKTGDYFGESSLNSKAPNYRFRANVDSTVCVITVEALERAMGGARAVADLSLRTFDKRGVEISGPTAVKRDQKSNSGRRSAHGSGSSPGQLRSLVGLKNLGNTCYMNSCIQCLSHTENLRPLLQTAMDNRQINQQSRYKGGVAKAMTELVSRLYRGVPRTAEVPKDLKREMGRVHRMFAGFAQQDSQELLRYLLDGLHEDTNRIKGKVKWEELKDIDGESDENKAARYWENHVERNDSPITDLFTGQLMSVLTCRSCGHRSASFDPVMDVSVPLVKPSGRKMEQLNTLKKCLDEYVAEELLQKMEQVYCSKCKDHKDHTKSLSFARLPKILVVHLKRFERNRKLTT